MSLPARRLLAVLARARVGGDRLGTGIAQQPVGADPKAPCRWEAFLLAPTRQVGGVGFAADNQAEDPVLAAEALEGNDFLVNPTGFGCLRRADHDLAGRLLQRRVDDRSQIGCARQLLAVAKYRCQAFGNQAPGGDGADQDFWRPVRFEALMQPRRPPRVAMAIARETARVK